MNKILRYTVVIYAWRKICCYIFVQPNIKVNNLWVLTILFKIVRQLTPEILVLDFILLMTKFHIHIFLIIMEL